MQQTEIVSPETAAVLLQWPESQVTEEVFDKFVAELTRDERLMVMACERLNAVSVTLLPTRVAELYQNRRAQSLLDVTEQAASIKRAEADDLAANRRSGPLDKIKK